MRLLLIAALAAFLSQACRREQPALQFQPGPDSVAVARMSAPPPGRGPNAYLAFTVPCGKDSLLAFWNDTTSDYDYAKHDRFDSLRSDQGVFISVMQHEYAGYAFVANADCGRLEFVGRPGISPDGKRFAASGTHFASELTEMIVAALDAGKARVEWKDDFDGGEAVVSRWLDDSTWTAEMKREGKPGLLRTLALRGGQWSARLDTLGAGPEPVPAEAAPPYPEAVGESADP